MRASRLRTAFTLIELLVVIAIIGILVSLLMSAVQRARGAANKVACANNLHQIAIATHLYENDNNKFPPAAKWDYDATGTTGTQTYVRRGVWPYLLPYVEEGNIAFDFTQQWSAPGNSAAVAVSIKLFRCPASPGPQYVTGTNGQQACTDYAPLAGASGQLQSLLTQSHGPTQTFDSVGTIYPGFFNNINKDTDPVSGFGDITDGLSNTIMMVECSGRNDLWIGRQKNATAVFADDDSPDTSTLAAGKTTGGPWGQPRNQVIVFGFNTASQQLVGTNFINACNSGEVYSFHTNVANFAFGDGSVRTLNSTIAPDTFISLVTRSGGEPVSAP